MYIAVNMAYNTIRLSAIEEQNKMAKAKFNKRFNWFISKGYRYDENSSRVFDGIFTFYVDGNGGWLKKATWNTNDGSIRIEDAYSMSVKCYRFKEAN